MSERRVPVNFLRTWREGRGSRAASTVAGVGMNRVEEALVCEAMPAPDGMRWWERAWRSSTSRRCMVGKFWRASAPARCSERGRAACRSSAWLYRLGWRRRLGWRCRLGCGGAGYRRVTAQVGVAAQGSGAGGGGGAGYRVVGGGAGRGGGAGSGQGLCTGMPRSSVVRWLLIWSFP